MQIDDIETPALILDASRMDANIARMRARMRQLGVAFRPHLKTSKCIEVAHRMVDGTSGPATVSTLKEAEYFFSHGFTDILYAVGISAGKLGHVADMRGQPAFAPNPDRLVDRRREADGVGGFVADMAVIAAAALAGLARQRDDLVGFGEALRGVEQPCRESDCSD